MRYLTECREFFGQFRQQYHDTGSISSSRYLARALASPLARRRGHAGFWKLAPVPAR